MGEWLSEDEFEGQKPRQPCISWVLQGLPKLRAAEWKVIVVIAKFADPDGSNAYPAHATIAKISQIDERTVRRAIQELERLGLLLVDVNGGGSPKSRPDRRTNRYTVIPRAEAAPTVTPCVQVPERGDTETLPEGAWGSEREGVEVPTRGLWDPPTIPDNSLTIPETNSAMPTQNDIPNEPLTTEQSLARIAEIKKTLHRG